MSIFFLTSAARYLGFYECCARAAHARERETRERDTRESKKSARTVRVACENLHNQRTRSRDPNSTQSLALSPPAALCRPRRQHAHARQGETLGPRQSIDSSVSSEKEAPASRGCSRAPCFRCARFPAQAWHPLPCICTRHTQTQDLTSPRRYRTRRAASACHQNADRRGHAAQGDRSRAYRNSGCGEPAFDMAAPAPDAPDRRECPPPRSAAPALTLRTLSPPMRCQCVRSFCKLFCTMVRHEPWSRPKF
jgi:hypothetical protein